MKKIYLILIALMVSGCNITSSSPSGSELLRDILESTNRYSINSCYDEVVEYIFYDDSYTKIFYEDESFGYIKDKISDKVEYIDSLNLKLYENNITLDCGVQVKENNIVVLYCINEQYKDNPEYYHVKRTLYPTKDEAIAHANEDCP